ncbi:hypothetical protein CerSpe_150730 [Prunus speciosa]
MDRKDNLPEVRQLGFWLNSWRWQSLQSFSSKEFTLQDLVERVAVIFFNSDSTPVERFMFKLTVNQSYGSRVEEADLEFSLRSFFIKLPFSESLTRVLPQDCRWEITAYFRSLPQASTSKDAELWIPTENTAMATASIDNPY